MNNVYIQGAVIAVIGLSTVFVVLALLWSVLELMRVFFTPKAKKADAPKQQVTKAPAPAAPAPAPAATEDDGELIAVLSAAVAACLDKPASALRIAAYRRVDANAPIWNRTARRDNILG